MNRVQIHTQKILNLMATIEALTGIMFQERYPELEQKFWAANDAKDERKLLFLVNQFALLADDIARVKGGQ